LDYSSPFFIFDGMGNFQHILKQISESLSKVSYDNGDLSDVGNEVGIAIGNYITTEKEFKDFIQGLRHGISLTNGEH
jgi:hypothetical protein